jgi:hypothetical protein
MIAWAEVITESGLTAEQVYAIKLAKSKAVSLFYYDLETKTPVKTTEYDVACWMASGSYFHIKGRSKMLVSSDTEVIAENREFKRIAKDNMIFVAPDSYQKLSLYGADIWDIFIGIRFPNGAPLYLDGLVLKVEWDEEQIKERDRILTWFDPTTEIGEQAFKKGAQTALKKSHYIRKHGARPRRKRDL